MQVEAIYDHGKLEFSRPLRLRHQRIKVVVEVPDMEIDDSSYQPTPEAQRIADEIDKQIDAALNAPLPQVVEKATAMRDKLDAIRNAPFPPEDELPELTEKQLDRIDAFKLREDR